jgi:hypothetical protein
MKDSTDAPAERPASGRWFEDLPEGLVVHHAVTRTITEGDNTLFSTMTMNPQPLHLDAEFASRTEFGERLVNSLFTLGLLVGITVYELTLGTTVANLGFGKVEFPAPYSTATPCAPSRPSSPPAPPARAPTPASSTSSTAATTSAVSSSPSASAPP